MAAIQDIKKNPMRQEKMQAGMTAQEHTSAFL
jgi:hypothetical protein